MQNISRLTVVLHRLVTERPMVSIEMYMYTDYWLYNWYCFAPTDSELRHWSNDHYDIGTLSFYPCTSYLSIALQHVGLRYWKLIERLDRTMLIEIDAVGVKALKCNGHDVYRMQGDLWPRNMTIHRVEENVPE